MTTTKTIAALAILLILSACAPITGHSIESDTQNADINLGAILILSGAGADWGEHSREGIELAVSEINAAGGINGRKVRVKYEDNPSDEPMSAVNALHKLTSEDIKLVIGTTWSSSGLASAPIACEQQSLMISPTLGVAGFNEACDTIFNVWPHDSTLNEQYGRYIAAKGYRKLAIIGSQQAWEKEQAEAIKRGFESAGGSIVVYELPSVDQSEFKTEALKIRASGADAIALTSDFRMTFASQDIRKAGITTPIFAVHADPSYLQKANGALEGAHFSGAFTPSASFIAKYTAKYGKAPQIGADTSYDSVMLLADAISTTGSTEPTVVAAYLNNLTTYNGASGQLHFDGKGGVTKAGFVEVGRGNSLEFVEMMN